MGRPTLAQVKTAADGSTIKLCRGMCGEWRPIEKFGRHRTCAGGRRNICSTCEGRQAYKNSRARVIKAVRSYQARHPERVAVVKRAGRRHRHGAKFAGPGVTAQEFRDLIKMYDGRCAYCGGPYETMDHVTPISRGGLHIVDNLVPACRKCNFTKRNKSYIEWMQELETR